MKIREGISAFLKARVNESPFLIPQWSPQLETQILVKKGSEETDPNVYTAEGETWTNHRWPYKAATDPQYTDRNLTYDPGKRIARIGSTWWNWERRESIAVGFDIDAEDSGHAAGTNQLDEFKLGQVVAKLSALPYVTLVRSTGGKGIHGYVFFDDSDRPKTANHSEHTQVGISVIEKIKIDTGMDMVNEKIVDVKGVVLWFWSAGSGADHDGFTVVHQATETLKACEIPEWDKVTVKSKVTNYKSNYQQCDLDEEHVAILSNLEDLGYAYSWNEEHNTAQTHTFALKILHEKMKNEGTPIKGIFHTVSGGSDPSQPNCYITAKANGVFKVARYGNAATEHPTWFSKEEDTWTFFNQQTDPMTVLCQYALTHDMSSATLDAEAFDEALEVLGIEFSHPGKQVKVVYDSAANSLVASVRYKEDDPIPPGWTKVGKKMTARLPIDGAPDTRATNYLEEIDDQARFMIQPNSEPYGWYHNSSGRGWIKYPASGNIVRLLSQQFGKTALDEVLAMMQNHPWLLANEPFGPEELPDREWNVGAARFKCEPADKPGPHIHFDKVLDHLGKGLDLAVANCDWAGEWGLESGADYLRYWVASAVKYPFEPLPYLFFFGQQGCGKSIFIEILDMLFPNAVMDVATAMKSEAGFNAEVFRKVFCVIEEANLAEGRQARACYERVKEWTTAKKVSVHEKGKTPYMQRNTMKFIHNSNTINAIQIDRDDTRVVAVDVPKLHEPIPKSILLDKIEEEAPYILRTLLTTQIPPALERFRVPHLNTVAKMELGEINMSPVQKFAQTILQPCPGNIIQFTEFSTKFDEWAVKHRANPMGRNAISSELRKMEDLLVLGKHGKQNRVVLGNVKFKDTQARGGKKLTLQENGRLA